MTTSIEPVFNSTITAIGQALRAGSLTSEQLVKLMCDRMITMNPTLNSFITILSSSAIQRAIQLDEELQCHHDRGQLHGIPIAVKDNIDTAGILTTIGSAHFCDRIPATDAAIVQALEAAGAILLGKTNLSEFAANLAGQNTTYGHMTNPWNINHTAGGSSGGMASAIASQLCFGGIGTDTGGSIRIPASWCGIVGLRPTPGLVSSAGVFPRAPSFDTVGVMARCVTDAEILWHTVTPSREVDLARLLTVINIATDRPLQGLRIGIVSHYVFRDIDAAIAQAIHHVIHYCQQAGATIIPIACPFFTQQFDPRLYSTIGLYEFHQILGAAFQADPQNFSAKVQHDLTQGRQITIADYTQAQTIRYEQIAAFRLTFHAIDLLLTPTAPRVAPLLTEPMTPRDRRFVQPISWLGLPALSLPCGWSGDLPIGLQLVGDRHTESLLLQVAAVLEARLLSG